jgi:hypothetical protein
MTRTIAIALVILAAAGLPRTTLAQTVVGVLGPEGDGAGNTVDISLGLAVDAAGNLYVASFRTDSVFRVTPAGAVSEIYKSVVGPGTALLEGPTDVVVDQAGDVYVVDSESNQVVKLHAGSATVVLDASGDGAGNVFDCADPNFFCDLAIDAADNLYVAGQASDNVFRISPGGVVTTMIDATGDGAGHPFSFPGQVAVDGAGTVYVVGGSGNVFRITAGGLVSVFVDGTGGMGSVFAAAGSLAVDSAGNLYAGGEIDDSPVVIKVTPGGTPSTVMTSAGDSAGHPLISTQFTLTVDAADNLFVPDLNGRRVFRVRPGGSIAQVVGPEGDGSGGDVPPYAVAIDGSGDLFMTVLAFSGTQALKAYLCPEEPLPGCRTPTADLVGRLNVRDRNPDTRDSINWKWTRGQQTFAADFGNPFVADDVTLCMYDRSSSPSALVLETSAPPEMFCPDPPCWRATNTGFRYTRKTFSGLGMLKMSLKAGVEGRASIVAQARGDLIEALPPLPIGIPVTMQIQASSGTCWEANYRAEGVKKNDATDFAGRPSVP